MSTGIKKQIIIVGLIVAVLAVAGLGLLYYYQKQGLIKVFPTVQEKTQAQALIIDRSKFKAPTGTSAEDFEKRIAELETYKGKILKDSKDLTSWLYFAAIKSFLNDHQGAADAWEIAYQIQPADFRISQNLGNVYQYFLKDYIKSESNYLKVLALRPDFTLAYEGLMDLYRYNMKENSVKYEPLVLQAIAEDKANAAEYYGNLVEFFAETDQVKAKTYLAEVRKLKPANAESLLTDYPALK